jgi:hypothetical protein
MLDPYNIKYGNQITKYAGGCRLFKATDFNELMLFMFF